MQFNSYVFILCFLPITLAGYFLLGKVTKNHLAKLWLIVMSLWFYSYVNIKYLWVLLLSLAINYAIAYMMHKKDFLWWKKLFLIIGITINVLVLFIIKYYNFFIDNINHVFQKDFTLIQLVLPLGISFITFQQISFLVDRYREKDKKCSLIDYALYLCFFPKIVSGPIIMYHDFIPQINHTDREKINYSNLSKGLYQFSLGLAKKVLVADSFSKFADIGFQNIYGLNILSAVCTMLCFTLQLYFDFSGYSDMANGVALMLNIELPDNFLSPYKAKSVSDFWKRWHISLTAFFTNYVYIPLGGNRKGIRRTCLNIMIIFAISGLWHGANWTFIIWGCLHGLFMVMERVTKRKIEKIPLLGWLYTFIFVNMAWVIFRSDNLSIAATFFQRLFYLGKSTVLESFYVAMNEFMEVRVLCRFGLQGIVNRYSFLPFFLFLVIMLGVTLKAKNVQERVNLFAYKRRQMVGTVIMLLWSIISLSNVTTFLYVNF